MKKSRKNEELRADHCRLGARCMQPMVWCRVPDNTGKLWWECVYSSGARFPHFQQARAAARKWIDDYRNFKVEKER
jgi:hypothetical protein